MTEGVGEITLRRETTPETHRGSCKCGRTRGRHLSQVPSHTRRRGLWDVNLGEWVGRRRVTPDTRAERGEEEVMRPRVSVLILFPLSLTLYSVTLTLKDSESFGNSRSED